MAITFPVIGPSANPTKLDFLAFGLLWFPFFFFLIFLLLPGFFAPLTTGGVGVGVTAAGVVIVSFFVFLSNESKYNVEYNSKTKIIVGVIFCSYVFSYSQ